MSEKHTLSTFFLGGHGYVASHVDPPPPDFPLFINETLTFDVKMEGWDVFWTGGWQLRPRGEE